MTVNITTRKTCTQCLITKPAEGNFYKQGRGYRAVCKACVSMLNARYRALHADEIKASAAAWREQNPDYQKQWKDAHPDYDKQRRRRKKDAGGN